MKTLIQSTNDAYEMRRQSYIDARKMLTLTELLPTHIQNFESSAMVHPSYYPTLNELNIAYHLDANTDDKPALQGQIMSMWKKLGLVWDSKSEHVDGKEFRLLGKMNIDEENVTFASLRNNGITTIEIRIYGLPRPPTCKLIERTEVREVTVYEAICAEDEEATLEDE